MGKTESHQVILYEKLILTFPLYWQSVPALLALEEWMAISIISTIGFVNFFEARWIFTALQLFATGSVLISAMNRLKSMKKSSKEWQNMEAFLEIVMITLLYTGHLSHSETSTIRSHMLCFVPLADRKNKELGSIAISCCCKKEWQLKYSYMSYHFFLKITFLFILQTYQNSISSH